MRILLVEDNENDVILIQELLVRAEGAISFFVVDRLSRAIAQLQSDSFDVVLLDLSLPDGNGLDTFFAFREQAPSSIPVVILTGCQNIEIALQALRNGAQDYLFKDRMDGEMIIRALRYAIERKAITDEINAVRQEAQSRAVELARANAALNQISLNLENANKQLEQWVVLDTLTELLNRRGLQRILVQEAKRAIRDSVPQMALLFDVDDFKKVNDQMGHDVGDQVLRQVSDQVRGVLRASDYAARIGGDEFLILLPDTRPAEGMLIAERIRLAIGEISVRAFPPWHITASSGLYTIPSQTLSLEEVLSHGSPLLHQSKKRGKDRISCEGIQGENREDVLAIMCQGDRFRSVKQNIVCLVDGKVIGYELMTRLASPGYEMPADFFHAALHADMLPLVDHHCLRASSAFAAASSRSDLQWHINLFPSTLANLPISSLIEEIGNIKKCCIEISEHHILGEPSYLLEPINTLREADVLIAMDDVGYGHTPLESLLILQPDYIKIDRACISGVHADPSRRRLLKRLLRVADTLKTKTIAEGIEEEEDRAILKDMGVAYGQGFLLGRPG